MWNEEPIKKAIMKGRSAGICDKNGNTIRYRSGRKPGESSEAGKGDTYRPVNRKKYEKNYTSVFGTKLLNIWPRDEDGKLIGA